MQAYERIEGDVPRVPGSSLARVSWAGIFAGAISAIACMLTLNLLVGWLTAGTPMSARTGIWFLIVTWLSFFIGGWVAARLAGIPNRGTGALHGFVVWSLAILALLIGTLYIGGRVAGLAMNPNMSMSAQAATADVGRLAALGFFGLVLSAVLALLGGVAGTPARILVISEPALRTPVVEEGVGPETEIRREEPPRRIA